MTLRIGVLGAARITGLALIRPASTLGIPIHSVAARNSDRALVYAAKHGIPHVRETYAALLRDSDINAVYIPLPASRHAEWTLAAIDAGKHVLVEKPFTANANQAQQVAEAATVSQVVVMEAYHSGHHPLLQRLRHLTASGELGEILSARATFAVAIPPGKDIRWNVDLGGGSLLDVGYYPVRLLRDLFGEPAVLHAHAKIRRDVDSSMSAVLQFPDGVRGEVASSLWPPKPSMPALTITGTAGKMRVRMPYHPQTAGRITFVSGSKRWTERPDQISTYVAQLQNFRAAVEGSGANTTDAAAAVPQMRTLDAIYQAAGMSPRCT